MARQAGQARPKGSRRPLDGEVLQGQASKAKPAADGTKRADIAVPAFGYKNHVGINRRHGLIRTWLATDASRHDGAQLPGLVSKANTGSDVWADTSYRTKANEQLWPTTGCARKSTAKSRQGDRCRSTWRVPTG